ncbi:MAG TPA: phosphate acyltransferase PlsX [Rhizomicrobium sp.]|nr:phosphate acyltransferase PlsX [Rhizomicrobium sp.]
MAAPTLTVSIDAMGGDAGPGVVVAAVGRAVVRHPNVKFLLHGDEAELAPLTAKRTKLRDRFEIRHAPERVRMEDKPSQIARRGRNTSMWRAIESVAKKEADVVVSAGNTGALMAMSLLQLRTLDGIERPAIAALWPTLRGQSVVLDVGANIDTDAQQLVDFAVMGEAFARAILGLEKPTLGILNVGEEDLKGNEAVRGAAQILRTADLPIDFQGFVEGDDISSGTVDVVVTDGFTGNVALKTAEGAAKLIIQFLRNALTRSLFGKIGAMFAAGALGALRRKLDPRASNGGIFLGLNGVVVKSHGGTDALGFASALDMAIDMAKADVTAKIVADRAGLRVTTPAMASGAGAS